VNLVVAFRLEKKNNIESIIKQKYSQFQSKIQLLENLIYDVSATDIRNYLEEFSNLNDNGIYLKLSKLINQFTIESYLQNKKPTLK
jgi:nicotinic acid mononucleotide adenylyltransferase